MSEATISFSDHDQIRTLFGTRDKYLRQVRDTIGVDVVIRDGDVHLHGNEEQIKRGLEIFAELRAIVEKKGRLHDAEVRRALTSELPDDSNPSGDCPRPVNDLSDGDRVAVETAEQMPPPTTPIELFEKAKQVAPRSPGQVEYVHAIRENDLVFAVGPAGCGKTYLAVAMAINALRTEQVRKIVLVRPALEAGEKLGFLPGDLLAKVNPFLRPLLDSLNDLVGYEQVKRYMENDVIEIVPLAFMRGRTLNETFIILDEGQNTTVTQMKMFLTRMGIESKIVVTGDTTQVDLPTDVSCGLTDAIRRLGNIDKVASVELTGNDIVRHHLVREMVRAYQQGPGRTKSAAR